MLNKYLIPIYDVLLTCKTVLVIKNEFYADIGKFCGSEYFKNYVNASSSGDTE